jgi:hypothetical protein
VAFLTRVPVSNAMRMSEGCLSVCTVQDIRHERMADSYSLLSKGADGYRQW